MIVVDTSIVIGWAVESQSSELGERALEQVLNSGWTVPFIFMLEFASALRGLERRKRIPPLTTDTVIKSIEKMSPVVDAATQLSPQSTLLPLARKLDITLYDAAYLELSLRTKYPLATRDKELAAAARIAGAGLFH